MVKSTYLHSNTLLRVNIMGVNTIPGREIPKLRDRISFLVPKIFGFRMPNSEIFGFVK